MSAQGYDPGMLGILYCALIYIHCVLQYIMDYEHVFCVYTCSYTRSHIIVVCDTLHCFCHSQLEHRFLLVSYTWCYCEMDCDLFLLSALYYVDLYVTEIMRRAVTLNSDLAYY